MKIAENDFKLDIGLIVFAFAVILQLFGTFKGISFCPLQKLVYVWLDTTWTITITETNNFEPEEQGGGIEKGTPCPIPMKKILSKKSGPIEGAQYAYHVIRLQ